MLGSSLMYYTGSPLNIPVGGRSVNKSIPQEVTAVPEEDDSSIQ